MVIVPVEERVMKDGDWVRVEVVAWRQEVCF